MRTVDRVDQEEGQQQGQAVEQALQGQGVRGHGELVGAQVGHLGHLDHAMVYKFK